MIRVLQIKKCADESCWHIVRDRGIGYGFNDGWPILRMDFKPGLIATSADILRCNQYLDTKCSRLVRRSHGDGFDLVSCGPKRDERLMLITDKFNINEENASVLGQGADILYYSFTERTVSTGWKNKWGRLVIRFEDPNGYILVKILPKDWTAPFGYAYSWRFGHLHIGVERLEEFEANPLAYFSKKVPEDQRFEAELARYRERRRLVSSFERIIAHHSFASLPTERVFTFDADAVVVSFGDKTIRFCYHKDALRPFKECVELIDGIYRTSFAPVWYYGGELCAKIVSDSGCCNLTK